MLIKKSYIFRLFFLSAATLFAQSSYAQLATYEVDYIVQQGDSLSTILHRLGVSSDWLYGNERLLKRNEERNAFVHDWMRLRAGMRLRLIIPKSVRFEPINSSIAATPAPTDSSDSFNKGGESESSDAGDELGFSIGGEQNQAEKNQENVEEAGELENLQSVHLDLRQSIIPRQLWNHLSIHLKSVNGYFLGIGLETGQNLQFKATEGDVKLKSKAPYIGLGVQSSFELFSASLGLRYGSQSMHSEIPYRNTVNRRVTAVGDKNYRVYAIYAQASQSLAQLQGTILLDLANSVGPDNFASNKFRIQIASILSEQLNVYMFGEVASLRFQKPVDPSSNGRSLNLELYPKTIGLGLNYEILSSDKSGF